MGKSRWWPEVAPEPEARAWLVEMCARFPVAELEALAKLALVKKMATVLKNAA